MDRQCEDRAHRIGQIRDVHIYRFVSKYTIEEALLQKANQKRSLDDLVIQQGEFDWRMVFQNNKTAALTEALGAVEDIEDADAARAAAREANDIDGADADDFDQQDVVDPQPTELEPPTTPRSIAGYTVVPNEEENQEEEEEGGTVEEYMLQYVVREDEREYFEL
jgi:helicase SWR1